jgi:pyridoxamine 5'-phosphate oxidase
MNKEISHMRQTYRKSSLNIADLHPDPIESFKIWFQEAKNAEVPEPNVMTLATADNKGNPSARIVLLKGVDERGFIFYTNYKSSKGEELVNNPRACLVFFWQELERQVRITGSVEKVSREESEVYFHSRPRESQIGAWTSPQSKIIEDRDYLNERYEKMLSKFSESETIPIPDFWGGYIIVPETVEFWQGRPSRLHDRIIYTNKSNQWKKERLAP